MTHWFARISYGALSLGALTLGALTFWVVPMLAYGLALGALLCAVGGVVLARIGITAGWYLMHWLVLPAALALGAGLRMLYLYTQYRTVLGIP